MSSKSLDRRRLSSAVAGLIVGALLLSGCGTGQKQAGSYDDLEAAFLKGCRATATADAKKSEAKTLPADFCRCAFDALSDKESGVEFDRLMEINEEFTSDPAELPAEVTEAFSSCAGEA